MGIHLFSHSSYDDRKTGMSHSSYDKPKESKTKAYQKTANPANPNPFNFVINRKLYIHFGEYLLLDITYPDCTNYEGRKILLYKGVTLEKLLEQKSIDPHFSDNKDYHSPVARFEPTKEGWKMAVDLIYYAKKANKEKR